MTQPTDSPFSPLIIPDRAFAGYIFDCDGTLVDSMPIHYDAWVMALRENGAEFEFTEEEFYAGAGIHEHDIVAQLNAKHVTNVDPHAVAAAKMRLLPTMAKNLRTVAPVEAFAKSFRGKIPMAVASGSPEELVRLFLDQLGMLDWFETIVTPANVKRGKPAPDMFLLAAERMGVNPGDCLVFEDGQSGIDAAKAAGMEVVFVPRL